MSGGDDNVFLADAALIACLLNPFAAIAPPAFDQELPMVPKYSADVPDTFLAALVGDCGPGGLACDPSSLVACWLSESGLSPRAQNKSALAAGFFQAMPATLRGMGFRGDATYLEPAGAHAAAERAHEQAKAAGDAAAESVQAAKLRQLDELLSDAFTRMSLGAQLVWANKYYHPHAGKLVSPGACYAANFVPAWISHATELEWVICSKDGRNDAHGLTVAESQDWYRENATLDVDGDGAITMGDLATKAGRELETPRGQELVARLAALRIDETAPDTQPSVPDLSVEAGLDIDMSGVPDEPDDVG